MPTRRTNRQVSQWTRSKPKPNTKTRGLGLKKVAQLERQAGAGRKQPHQERIERMVLGRGSAEAQMAQLLKKPGARPKAKLITKRRRRCPTKAVAPTSCVAAASGTG